MQQSVLFGQRLVLLQCCGCACEDGTEAGACWEPLLSLLGSGLKHAEEMQGTGVFSGTVGVWDQEE